MATRIYTNKEIIEEVNRLHKQISKRFFNIESVNTYGYRINCGKYINRPVTGEQCIHEIKFFRSRVINPYIGNKQIKAFCDTFESPVFTVQGAKLIGRKVNDCELEIFLSLK